MQGRPAVIPDCSRDDLPEFFKEMKYTTGAEIGVSKGEFSIKFCGEGLKLYAVDPWSNYSDYNDPRGQERLDLQYEYVKKILAPYDCTIIRKTSMEAVEDFPDESLDFVYIDGNHDFRYIAEDIFEWSKKVRKGGIISGHDYFYTYNSDSRLGNWHVAYVVNAYTQAYDIKNWYLLGRKECVEGEKRDKRRSWMWFKQ